MPRIIHGDLLKADAHVLVNAVNCVGVMGGGLALAFKKSYPQMFRDYAHACRNGEVVAGGKPHTWPLDKTHYIYNFPTKDHWKDPSRIEWVSKGLVHLRDFCDNFDKTKKFAPTVALPPLGCGLGGLDWDDVKPVTEEAFKGYAGAVTVYFYP